MKTAIAAFILLAGSLSMAATTLGIPDGHCRGGGVLKASHALAPDIAFESVRTLENGMIRARSTIKLLGFPVTATADLKFIPTGPNTFRAESLTEIQADGTPKPVGQAACDETACRFQVTVSGGNLYLEETLVRTDQGFRIVDGFQKLYGIPNHYSGEFICR